MGSLPHPFPPALESFVARFNRAEFWDSHEVLEAAWRESGSDFYHGLILFASAFVHAQRGNPHGIVAQLVKAERCLEKFRPTYLGIDVGALLSHARSCRRVVRENPEANGDQWSDIISFPEIPLRSEHLAGNELEIRR